MGKNVVGIDLGTTYSAVAYVDHQDRPRIIPNADGKTTTPSVVLVQEGRREVGDLALDQWITNEEHVCRWVKRSMGSLDFRFQGLTASEVSAEILRALRADAERHLDGPIDEAVITCPAYFAAVEIEETKRAGELAGLSIREIVKEPTAAAVFHGVETMRDGQVNLVCDLGGGTFDATVLTFEGGAFLPMACLGVRELGGHDWTMALVEMVASRARDQLREDPRDDLLAGQLLYESCEAAKRDLARLSSVTIPCRCRGRATDVVVLRDEFEEATEGYIGQVVACAEGALAKARPPLTWGDVDRVLLVGGASRLRRVGAALQEASGNPPMLIREPDLAVAYGAAILAHGRVRPRRGGLIEVPEGLVEVVSARILPRALGTRAIARDGGRPRVLNAPIIPQNTRLPISCTRDDFEVTADRQEYFDIPVVEFEDTEDDAYELVGNYRCRCLPDARRGDRIRVAFHYDISGIPRVEATDARSGAPLQVERLGHYQDPDPDALGRTRWRWVVFAVDVSFSMDPYKLSKAKQAVLDHARTLLASGGAAGLVCFGAVARVLCPPTTVHDDLERAVDALVPFGTTAMDAGIRLAVGLLTSAPDEAEREVALITDGMPDDERRDATLAAAAEARAAGVRLSTVGIGAGDVDIDFLKQLTPLALVVETAAGLAEGVGHLLSLAPAPRQAGPSSPSEPGPR